MTEMKKLVKLVEIMAEMYDENPKYCVDCFFDAYFQFKKKKVVDDRSYGDAELKQRIWSAINYYNKLIKEDKMHPGKAFNIAYRTYKVDKDLFNSIVNSCRAFKSSKKTKFKNLY